MLCTRPHTALTIVLAVLAIVPLGVLLHHFATVDMLCKSPPSPPSGERQPIFHECTTKYLSMCVVSLAAMILLLAVLLVQSRAEYNKSREKLDAKQRLALLIEAAEDASPFGK